MNYKMVDGQLVKITAAEARDIAGPKPAPFVPDRVTNFQARALLIRRGLFDAVDAAIQAGKNGADEEREAFQAWEFGNEFLRDSPTLARIAAGLGLSDAERDEMIIEASKIEA